MTNQIQKWRHVAGELNPADEASRGLTPTELLHNHRWFHGPEFLWQEIKQIQAQFPAQLDPNDQEVKKDATTVLTTKQVVECEKGFPKFLEADRFKHFSSFDSLKRSIIFTQRMIERKRPDKHYNWRPQEGPPTVRELEEAERTIFKSVQYKHFSAEIGKLERLIANKDMFPDRYSARARNSTLKHTSCLYRLDPFLDGQGVLRVGGRLKNAVTPFEVRHPILVPKNDHVTILLIRHHHIEKNIKATELPTTG